MRPYESAYGEAVEVFAQKPQNLVDRNYLSVSWRAGGKDLSSQAVPQHHRLAAWCLQEEAREQKKAKRDEGNL